MLVILLARWLLPISALLGATEISTINEVREWFAEYLEKENQQIHRIGQDEEHKGMGTTLKLLPLLMTKSYLRM